MSEFTRRRVREVIVVRESPNICLIERLKEPVAIVYDSTDADFLVWCLNNREEIKEIIDDLQYPPKPNKPSKIYRGGIEEVS